MKRVKLLTGIAVSFGVAIAILFFWNSQRVGRVLDGYKGVLVYNK